MANHEGSFIAEYDNNKEYTYVAHSWKAAGENQPQQFDVKDDNMPQMDSILLEVKTPEGKVTGVWVEGPFSPGDWETVEAVVGASYNAEGSR